MLKPPHAVATLAYAMAMRINPNNHALDGGPATAALERECVSQLARMFGFETHLGHLTSSGTIANLEALWVARQLRPGKAVAYSEQAHYTHGRMCEVLGVEGIPIATDENGRMSLEALQDRLEDGRIGTVVATLGTTGLGALDPVRDLADLAAAKGFRLHVDAAYGGFYALLARTDPPLVDPTPFLAVARADSLVVDPHKHGLQPYGCGCVLFQDPAVGALYKHDSPYTYFTSPELHLGEISLECSRAGAAAAALWATLRCFPLEPDRGLGKVLQATRTAALKFAKAVHRSEVLELVLEPELDILVYFPVGEKREASAIAGLTEAVFDGLMRDREDPVYLAKLALPRAIAAPHGPELVWDRDTITVLRSCLLKPEHEGAAEWLVGRIEREALRLHRGEEAPLGGG
jgi:glutamate/tyrosine decarboxylase-like PLP-dependent enzyme